MCLIIDLYTDDQDLENLENRSWYLQDEILLSVTKSIIEIFKAVWDELGENEDEEKEKEYEEVEDVYDSVRDRIVAIACTRAYLLIRMMSGGKKHSQFDPFTSPALDNISPKDLFEAACCLATAARYNDDPTIVEMIHSQCEYLANKVEFRERLQNSGMRSYIDRSVPGDFSVGSWVIVKGLQSKASALLNGKLGYILSGPSEERYAVDFDGIEAKKIKGCNLDPVPIDDTNRGIVASLKKEDQWSFMGDVVEGRIVLQE